MRRILPLALLVGVAAAGCGNDDEAKRAQAKADPMKGIVFGDPKPEPPPPPPPPPDVLKAKGVAPKGLVQNVRAAAYRPQRLNELKQIALYVTTFADENKRAPRTKEELADYMRREAGSIAEAIKEDYYVFNLKVNMRKSDSVIAYESLVDGAGHQTARVDGSVGPVAPDDLRKLLMEQTAVPTVLRFEGHRFFFFSNENDEPPHVHVERAESVAKFWQHPDVELAWARRFRGRDVTKLGDLIAVRQGWFLEKWNEHFEDEA